MKTDVVVFRSGGNFNYSVSIDGLDSLMRFLGKSDPLLRKALRDGLKEAAQPVLTRARANAARIADDGTFRDALSIRSYRGNTYLFADYALDEAAGVKEFARRGARYRPKVTDRRRNARAMARRGQTFPVGVPRRANPPRVMVPAVNDSISEVKTRIDAKLEEVLRGAENG